MAGAKQAVDYADLAKQIVANVGGKENVKGLRHCVTRCRFRLKDEGKANDEAIGNLDGVLTVVKSGGEYMVVIGDAVTDVYNACCAELGMADGVAVDDDGEQDSGAQKVNPVMRVLNVIVGSVGPALNLICAGGILKGVLTLLENAGVLASTDGLYLLLNGMGDAVFYFLPIILGMNLARHLKGDPFLGLIIGAILCYPTLNGVDLDLFGFVVNATYTSSFLPVVAIVAVAVPIAKFLDRFIPKVVSGFLVPVITLLIVIPLGFLVVGPAVNFAGGLVNTGINALLTTVPLLAGVVFAGFYQVMVLFGIHQALTSFSFMNVLSGTPDAVMAMALFPSFAQIGVVLAMYLHTRDQKLKAVALPAFISGIFGVTEPAIYGVTLPHIKMFVVSCVGAAVSGGLVMATNTLLYTFTGMGVFALLGMISPGQPSLVVPVAIAAIAFAVSFAIAFALYRDEN